MLRAWTTPSKPGACASASATPRRWTASTSPRAPGTVLGVLGPNGAGKTTAVRILATLLQADEGTRDRRRPRRRARARPRPRADRPHRPVRLGRRAAHRPPEPRADRRAARPQAPRRPRARERAARVVRPRPTPPTAPPAPTPAACAAGSTSPPSLVGRPAVVFLDEPTTGLDPAKRDDMWGVVRNLVADGSTVLLTTQYLEEADALADEITVIDHGRVIAHDTPDGLKRIVGGQTLSVRPADPTRLDEVELIVAELARRPSRPPGPRHRQRPGHRRRGAGRGRRPPHRGRHRRHRAVAAAAEPRRGVLRPHRPHTEADRARGGGRMTGSPATAPRSPSAT